MGSATQLTLDQGEPDFTANTHHLITIAQIEQLEYSELWERFAGHPRATLATRIRHWMSSLISL
jgi:hypothetical protein